MEGLDGVSMEVPLKCGELNCIDCPLKEREGFTARSCVEYLAAEVQRLRDKHATVVDIWKDAKDTAKLAIVRWYAANGLYLGEAEYTRTLPKTPERILAETVVDDCEKNCGELTSAPKEELARLTEEAIRTGKE